MNKTCILQTPCSDETKLLILKSSIFDIGNSVEIIDLEKNNFEDIPTLKDVSIVLTSMVGSGVSRQLAKELSYKLDGNISWKIIENYLWEIFKEYSELSQEEAEKRWEEI